MPAAMVLSTRSSSYLTSEHQLNVILALADSGRPQSPIFCDCSHWWEGNSGMDRWGGGGESGHWEKERM